jgi:hypothetical protein
MREHQNSQSFNNVPVRVFNKDRHTTKFNLKKVELGFELVSKYLWFKIVG